MNDRVKIGTSPLAFVPAIYAPILLKKFYSECALSVIFKDWEEMKKYTPVWYSRRECGLEPL